MLRTLHATRYVTPFREGGSMPALIESEDDGLYVLKFRGAGQGPKALIAELLGGEIARASGLKVPELVFIDLDPALGRNESDYEIRQLITASPGINLALDYLPGSLSYDPVANASISAELASDIVWFDAYIMNVDRTARNTNMLVWHKNLWLIDHGAALFFHHTWQDYQTKARGPFALIKDHVLLKQASDLQGARERMAGRLRTEVLAGIVQLIPETWLEDVAHFSDHDAHRNAYLEFLTERLASSETFTLDAIEARKKLV